MSTITPNFSEKIVLITGASSGMGKATALYLAEKGVKGLTLFARREAVLNEVKAEIESKYPGMKNKVYVVVGDAGKAEDNKRAVEETVKTFGGVTSAFVNAGVYMGGAKIEDTSQEDVSSILDVNVKGAVYAIQSLVPAIKKTVGEAGATGSIVVNSSCMGQAVIAPKSIGSSIYAASKAFVSNLVETVAIETAPRIRVNAVQPGIIKTSLMPVDDDTYNAIGAAMQPLWGRPGSPFEVASIVAFLLGDEASLISGTNIPVDGLWCLSGGSAPGGGH